ncbi:TatD family [Phascolomyces articulosus]|uniref:TatD family n=1 Tax=Phascolomyces articulosus TaxID=60185 RepID=A0AAD5K2J4_9FUNG|nr:TatD family [Phascolomyces articulosus]
MDNSKLCDAHCHPHDDIENLDMLPNLKTGHITVMGVRQDDWDRVAEVTNACEPGRCVPSFGIHPWFLHRLMVDDDADPETHYDQVLTTKIASEKQDMIRALDPPFSRGEWVNNLKQRLVDYPQALVGEVGLDRAARLLPGGAIEWHGIKPTTVQTSIEHQMNVLRIQLLIAREFKRPVSVHCVQASGHLLQLLQELAPTKKKKETPPPLLRLCLHSFMGSAGSIPQFLKLKGYAIYVSFSVAICGRMDKKKLYDLMASIPEDRILIESDLNTPCGLDHAMEEITKWVGEARQWTIEKTIEQTYKNWRTFVGGIQK